MWEIRVPSRSYASRCLEAVFALFARYLYAARGELNQKLILVFLVADEWI